MRLDVSTITGGCVARIVPSSGIVTAASASSSSRNASKSSSARSISSISSTAGRGPGCSQRAQQRPRDQVLAAEQRVLGQRASSLASASRMRQQLARIVPLVQRLGGVDPVVALQPDQRRVEHRGQRLGGLGLAHPGLPLQQQRLREAEAEEQRGGQPLVDQVVDGGEPLRQRLDVGREVLAAPWSLRRLGAAPASRPRRGPGCIGMSMWSTPWVSYSASITALTIAGGEPTLGDSPTPLAPSG